jgi:hypothetical protein
VTRSSILAQKANLPTATIVATAFLGQARAVAKSLGMANLGIAEFPGIIMNQSEEELRRNTETVLVPNILKSLMQMVETTVEVEEPTALDIVCEGTLDDVNEYFLTRQWTDGMPIIPPTMDRVQAFLRHTARSPEEVLGVLAPANREATVWNTAVNGVMSGCRPEYMPVLVALVECLADPEFHIRDAGATPGWEPLIILNGPIVKELDFNYGCGVLRVGRQANTSIGRFVRLYMRNIADLKISPGNTDKGSIAIGNNVVLAENEDAVAELGWESFSTQHGFAPGENVVSVQSALSPTIPIYSAGNTALEHMRPLVEIFGGTCAFWAHVGIRRAKNFPLLIISPGVAAILARDGWTKKEVQQYLFENTKVPVRALQEHAWQIGFTDYDLHALVQKRVLPPTYAESDDPDRLVPVFIKPEWIGIVLSGDPGRNQSKGFVQNHEHAPPVCRRIEVPDNWDDIRARGKDSPRANDKK